MGVEAGVPPRHDELDNLLRDLPFDSSLQLMVLIDAWPGFDHYVRCSKVKTSAGALNQKHFVGKGPVLFLCHPEKDGFLEAHMPFSLQKHQVIATWLDDHCFITGTQVCEHIKSIR